MHSVIKHSHHSDSRIQSENKLTKFQNDSESMLYVVKSIKKIEDVIINRNFQILFIMLLILMLAPLCITSVFGAVLKSGEHYAKHVRNSSVHSLIYEKVVNSDNFLVEINVNNGTDRVRSYDERRNEFEESRKKKEQDVMTRILPMMIIPFMLQTAIIPMMLTMLKFMLMKSAFIGKMAILLGLLNMFTRANNQGGVFTHNVHLGHQPMHQHLAEAHYGYDGHDEYGSYVNRRKRTIS